MISIYEYLDYQLFLRDFIEVQKKEKAWYSFRHFAVRTNMDHSNLIKIILGKRHASSANCTAIAHVLKLNTNETQYFKTLVEFGKTKNPAKTKIIFEKLIALKNVSLKTVEPNQYEYYRKWYHSAIYSLLDYYELKDDFAALASELTPVITIKQAKESIALLEKLGLICKESGVYKQTQKLITTGQKWRSIAIQKFQEETLKLAVNSLLHHPPKVRNISTLTMSLAKEDMLDIQELTEQYRKSIVKVINESGTGDTVYQLNIQLFPMTQAKWSLS